jgi:hypothetical protein
LQGRQDIEIRFDSNDDSSLWFYNYLKPLLEVQNFEDLFAFNYKPFKVETNGWDVWNPVEYWRNLIAPVSEDWCITDANIQYGICPTYSKYLVVPRQCNTKKILRESALFRTKRRFPVLNWRHPTKTSITLSRCSQPKTGIAGKQSKSDEALIQAIRLSNKLSSYLYIVDCRPKANALGNTIAKGGYESSNVYYNCRVEFMNIGNIHQMRDSWQRLMSIAKSSYEGGDDYRWCSDLENTGWLKHIKLILKATLEMVKYIEIHNSSVVVHCSDGWDRTSQLCSLVQLLIDPFFRTIRGFEILIEKEWCSFGYKFGSRTGHAKNQHSDERSPVFVQFLDCVWQVILQFPTAFEFNEELLIFIADSLYNCQYGTFLGDCELERMEFRNKTQSLWSFINTRDNTARFSNPIYAPRSEVLWISTSSKVIRFWENYWLRWDQDYRVVTKANDFHKNHILDLKKRIKELEKQVNNQMMNQFKNLATVAEADATSTPATKRNSLGPKNSLAVSSNISNEDTLVHVQDDDTNITGAEDGPNPSNNRSDLIASDDSVSSNSNENNSPSSTSQRNSLEEFVNMRNNNSDGNKTNEGGIQMQEMSPKTEETELNNYENSNPVPIKSPLHSFGSVGNSFARKFNLNQFLVGDDYQAPLNGPNSSNNSPNNKN